MQSRFSQKTNRFEDAVVSNVLAIFTTFTIL